MGVGDPLSRLTYCLSLHEKRPGTKFPGVFAFFDVRESAKALKIKGWPAATKNIQKSPQAKSLHDDN
jgi:hypothetical protein